MTLPSFFPLCVFFTLKCFGNNYKIYKGEVKNYEN